jgi:phasin family protein
MRIVRSFLPLRYVEVLLVLPQGQGFMPDSKQTGKAGEAARDETARTTRTAIDESAKAGEAAASSAADVARRGVDTAREATRAGFNAVNEAAQRTTDQFLHAFSFSGPRSEEVARASSHNVEVVSRAGSILARGFQEASREWIGLAQDRLTKNLEAFNRLAGCRSMQDVVALQSDLIRDNLRQVIDTGRRVAEVSLKAADEAARIIESQASTNAGQLRRAA